MAQRRNHKLLSALRQNSYLRPHVRDGLSAISGRDVELIAVSERGNVAESINLDAATQQEFPNDHRWDYIVYVRNGKVMLGIEPHPARDGEIQVVITKRRRAIAVLRDHLMPGTVVARWIWVSHGRVGFSSMERARRQLDQNGIEFSGRLIRAL